jgi:hypothetical protein
MGAEARAGAGVGTNARAGPGAGAVIVQPKSLNGTVLPTEGTTEKVSQFILPLMSVYNINLCFIEEKG